jgi:hypothetical protein
MTHFILYFRLDKSKLQHRSLKLDPTFQSIHFVISKFNGKKFIFLYVYRSQSKLQNSNIYADKLLTKKREWILSIYFFSIFLNFHISTINQLFPITFRFKYYLTFIIQWSIFHIISSICFSNGENPFSCGFNTLFITTTYSLRVCHMGLTYYKILRFFCIKPSYSKTTLIRD